MRIGFSGERGAYAEAAAAALFQFDIATRPMPSFEAVFDALESGEISCGVVPLENNVSGGVHKIYDLLRERTVYITHEVQIPTVYALGACRGARLETVKRIYGHPNAFSQCEDFLRSLSGVELIPRYDTEQSDRELIQRASPQEATLCSRFAAAMYGFVVLRKNCNSLEDSLTRFVALAKEARMPDMLEGDPMTMLLFETKHAPGSLMRNLEAFSEEGVNLLTLETRPTRKGDWEYTNFVTFEGRIDDPRIRAVMARLEKHTRYLRHLGTYAIKNMRTKISGLWPATPPV